MMKNRLTYKKRNCIEGIRPLIKKSSLIFLMVAALFILSIALPQETISKSNSFNKHWVGTWSTSPANGTGESFDNQTLRQIVHISIGGDYLRVCLTNRFGTYPLVIDSASIGVQETGASVIPGSLRALTFSGQDSITIAAGAKVLSDPVELIVADEADLAISLYFAGDTGESTIHPIANQTSYVSPAGDYVFDENMPTDSTVRSWYYLSGIEVMVHRNTHAVVTFGDSITDGFCDVLCEDINARYPDELARLILDLYPGKARVSVLNAGISGNRVIHEFFPDFAIFGPNAQSRLDSDVLTQSGVTHVILQEGINDIGFGLFNPLWVVSAEDIISGYRQIIERVHAMGLKILLGTLTPFKGSGYYHEEGEAKRQAVNEWIRTSNIHDGFIDFDETLRDPNDPEMLLLEFDSGDFLHPNPAGYAAMAETALDVLLAPRRRHIKKWKK